MNDELFNNRTSTGRNDDYVEWDEYTKCEECVEWYQDMEYLITLKIMNRDSLCWIPPCK